MPSIDLEKRNAVIRKYCPDLFEDERPAAGDVVLDVDAISRAAGRDLSSEVLNLLSDPHLERFAGKTSEEIAATLLEHEPTDSFDPNRPETLSLEEFFDGNTQNDSIAPNLSFGGHPGIEAFRDTLSSIRAEDGVLDVRIGVHEWPEPSVAEDNDIWIAAENVYFWTTGAIGVDDIAQWMKPLRPDGVIPSAEVPRPLCAPQMHEQIHAFVACWD